MAGGDVVCVFRADRDLVLALEALLGPPIDSYLNGWQVWIEPTALPDGREVELEYRLHPPAGFTQPTGLSHHDLWDEVATQLADGEEHLRLGEERRQLDRVWVLLEVFAPFGDEVSAEALRAATEQLLGVPALAAGRVDHATLGARWKRGRGAFDLAGALLDQLGVGP